MIHYLLTFLAVLTPVATALSQGNEPEFALEKVSGDLYRFTAGHYHSVVLATSDGILIADPVNTKAATWLKSELNKRFDAPVRYLVYSHNHFDHASGGEVFSDPSITVISHELAREDLEWTKTPTRLPDVTFRDEMQIHLGDQSVRLKYHGTNNGRGSISYWFEGEKKTLFVVDWILLGRMPYRDLKGYDIHGMIRSTREVLEQDFEIFIGGHGNIGKKSDVRHYLDYLEALYRAVVEGRRAGKTLEELKAGIRLDAFSDIPKYEEWLPLNIEGVFRTLDDRSYLDMQLEEKE